MRITQVRFPSASDQSSLVFVTYRGATATEPGAQYQQNTQLAVDLGALETGVDGTAKPVSRNCATCAPECPKNVHSYYYTSSKCHNCIDSKLQISNENICLEEDLAAAQK